MSSNRPVKYLALCKQLNNQAVEIATPIEVAPHTPEELAGCAFEEGWEFAIGMAEPIELQELIRRIQSPDEGIMGHPDAVALYRQDND